jgi:hypothetical protein
MLRLSCAGEVAEGGPVYGERGPVGQVARSVRTDAGSELLAVVHLDHLQGNLNADEACERSLTRLSLPYAVPA